MINVSTSEQKNAIPPLSATNVKIVEPTIFDLSSPGRTGVTMPASDVPETDLPPIDYLRSDLPLPELAELDVVRHYMHLSKFNYSVDSGFYPLGSCTMKYNPKINEDTCRLPGFLFTHPLQPVETVQGNLALMYELQEWLKEISGFAAVTLQPAAGAHGEFTGVLIMRAYHKSRGVIGHGQRTDRESDSFQQPAREQTFSRRQLRRAPRIFARIRAFRSHE